MSHEERFLAPLGMTERVRGAFELAIGEHD